jgi:hypothetical protein
LNGELPGFKIGDSWRFDMEEVVERIRAKKGVVGMEKTLIRKNNRNRERR